MNAFNEEFYLRVQTVGKESIKASKQKKMNSFFLKPQLSNFKKIDALKTVWNSRANHDRLRKLDQKIKTFISPGNLKIKLQF